MKKTDRERALLQISRDIGVITDLYEKAIVRLQGWAGRGFPTRSSGAGDGGSGGGDTNDPVMRIVISGIRDNHEKELADADKRLRRVHADLAWLARFAQRHAITVLPNTADRECENCGRVVAGTGRDRLRKGRCEPCYRVALRSNPTAS